VGHFEIGNFGSGQFKELGLIYLMQQTIQCGHIAYCAIENSGAPEISESCPPATDSIIPAALIQEVI
jgi:hypothetical protein